MTLLPFILLLLLKNLNTQASANQPVSDVGGGITADEQLYEEDGSGDDLSESIFLDYIDHPEILSSFEEANSNSVLDPLQDSQATTERKQSINKVEKWIEQNTIVLIVTAAVLCVVIIVVTFITLMTWLRKKPEVVSTAVNNEIPLVEIVNVVVNESV